MKTLIIARHAKSSWDHPGGTDHERPLNARGERDAPRMGRLLARQSFRPELILTSTAARARATADAYARALGIPDERLIATREIYHADASGLFAIISGIDAAVSCAMVVGHNPTVSVVASHFAQQSIAMPTCAVVAVESLCDDWAQFVTASTHRLVLHERPRKEE
ncbi:MAG: histidine phosphatase family protein [Ignavibacteria bacterium]|nr:histidine phosphatase family protein [Ignavibacteria bacterium]